MRRLSVYVADGFRGEPVEPVALAIEGALPDLRGEVPGDWQERYGRFYEEQAAIVLDALKALPQGTRHALLVAMLNHHANLYRGK